ncbi:pathogenesis-related protein PR5K (thaumatin family) [Ceratobasidium sp. AG-Ba]|nr:pathogenesis-related protein PR5K (thaumatin family) [Ceratobasidium sp. AG-Ba]
MHFSAAAVLSAVATLASSVQASHKITLKNNCSYGVGMYVHTWSGAAYTGAPNQDIPAGGSKAITVPDGWDGRICDKTASGVCANSCYGACSMTEFNMNAGGLNYYDISNIQAYSVPQKITSGCDSLICTSAGCPCNQAYRPGDMSGTCGGTGPVDQAVRACSKSDFTITYCP